jgi:hypothetical protein
VAWPWLPAALETATLLDGDLPGLTHDPTLTPATALRLYQAHYHPEQRCTWRQGTGILSPVLLKNPHRLEACFCVVGLVLPLLTRIEREAARRLAANGTPRSGCLKTCQTSQAPDHEMNHGDTDHGCTRLGQVLIIL